MTRHPIIGILLILLVAAIACSGGKSPVATNLETAGVQQDNSGRVIWGAFDLQMNPADGTAQIVWNRETQGHFNVTNFIAPPNCLDCIQIVGSDYHAAESRWYMQLAFKNPTNFTGKDVRAVITDPGGSKFLMNPDGLTDVWGSPMPFRAINVDPERTFGPLEVHGRMFDFFFPAGEKWNTVHYIVDASVPNYVEEPLIENGASELLPNNGFATTWISAKIWDHQGDLIPAGVTADLLVLGGSPMTPLFDDGAHHDGAAGDGTFGATGIKTTAASNYYMINVFAVDAIGHLGWGQVMIPVQGGTDPGNDDPIIDSITTDRTTVDSPNVIKITVNAHDPDSDPIGYQYTATNGTFQGQNGNQVNWKPGSQTGKQTITVHVLDDKGGEATQDINVWATTLGVINGSTDGMLPTANLQSFLPNQTLHMPADCLGKVTYINFWGTWCPPCVAEMPELQSMYDSYKSNPDFVRLQCGISDSQSAETNFINQNGYSATYWVVSDSYYNACQPFANPQGYVPTHELFDRDGRCRWQYVGGLSSISVLEDAIDQLL